MIKQGTISWLVGCHSIGHSICVMRAWRKLYGAMSAKVFFCILIHDIGHIGKQYPDNYEEKKKHWELGARTVGRLFGAEWYRFMAGHDKNSGFPESRLYKADKLSWYLAPTWWLYWNNIVEPKLTINCNGNMDAVRKFQAMVKESIESGQYRQTHDMYLERKGHRQ